ncbi:MAG: GAF domain-containing protein, partial [Chloroflexi bacterium]|nr:GAF domain-containing protein [Chloroflexota bacterium]
MARTPGLSTALRKWQQLNLWPRLALAVTLGFLVLFGIFSLLSLQAVNDSTHRILQERLVIAQMAAQEIDRLVERGFYELEKATEFAAFDPRSPSLADEYHMLAHAYGRVGTLSLGVYFLDAQGRVVLSEPPGKLPPGTDLSSEANIRDVKETKSRTVSDPFLDSTSGKPAVALTVPILAPDGTLLSMLSGLIDVTSGEITGPLMQARDIGHTGHTELVDRRGLIVASTDSGGFLRPGEHLPFYLSMFRTAGAGVENVPYMPWHAAGGTEQYGYHVMAFAPVPSAGWGLSVGGTDWETFAPVTSLRNTLLLAGALSLTFLWAVTLIGARLLVRPVRALTGAAQQMASGDLDQRIRVGEGAEIGILAESLETMRVQLKASLEQARRWGEELEGKVVERTKELATRNRQLAAVTAVATAANEIGDQEEMLSRCLRVVLENTQMDAASIRLLNGRDGQLTVASALGDFTGFPCRSQPVGLNACPCGHVASQGLPLYLGTEERQSFQPLCRAPRARVLAILPLKSPKGVLGVLSLSRAHGDPPAPEERETLDALCNQIAIAIENARLLGELSRVEAQHELDRMKAEFISAVSHELRTPLGFIRGYATTLLREDIVVDATTRRDFLQIIDEESSKLQRMIDDLLDASRLQAGRLPIDRSPFSFQELLDGVLHKVSPGLVEKGYTLVARCPETDADVLGDPVRIEQVLHNLVDNAARYSDPGSPVEIEATVQDQHLVVTVKDHGDGISANEVERVFEPFYRGANSRRRGVRGAGLGLAICRGIVEAHGGSLWVESRL